MGIQRYFFSDGTNTIELKYVRSITGLGISPVDITSKKQYRQDGALIQSVEYQARPFTIVFDMRGENYSGAVAERRALIRFFADKGPRTFKYTRSGWTVYLYSVYVSGAYESDMREISVLNGSMQFIASNPWLKKDIPASSAMLEIPVFEYLETGIEWTEGGLEYSQAENSLIVVNSGDIDADTIIRFIGPAITPYIENTTTNKRIEVNRTLNVGDTLEVNSSTGRVDVIDATENRHNAFNYITDDSEFITLAQGINSIEFGSAGGTLGYIEVEGVEYYAGI